MIVVLNAGMMVWGQYLLWEIYREERSALNRLSETTGFLLGMGTMAYGIVTQMLLMGFMVSVVHEGPRRQEPMTLLLAGRYYFWRWIRFLFVSEAILFAGMVLGFQLFEKTIQHVQSFQDCPMWAKMLIYFIPAAVLIKLALVVPADMIIRNRMVFESIRMMGAYSLGLIKALGLVYLVWQVGIGWIRWWIPEEGLADWKNFGIWSGQAVWMSVGQFVLLLWAVLEIKAIRGPQPVTISMGPTEGRTE